MQIQFFLYAPFTRRRIMAWNLSLEKLILNFGETERGIKVSSYLHESMMSG